MSSTYNYVNTVHVGDGINSGATTLATIQKGDLFLVNAKTGTVLNGTTVASLTPNDDVYIASGVGAVGQFKKSENFNGRITRDYAGSKYAAPVAQRYFIGYNGASQTLPVADQTEYELIIAIKDDQRVHGQKQTREVFNYTTGIGATQAQTAFGLASFFGMRSLNGNYKQYGGRFVDLEVVSSTASLGTNDNAAAVVKGSKVVTYTTAATYNTGTAITAGMYLRFNNTDGSFGEYLVTKVNGLLVYIDQPYAGVTRTVAAGQSGYYTAAVGNYGFRIDSQSVAWNGIDTYEVVAFDASMFNVKTASAAAAVVTKTREAFGGAGYWQQIYDLEYFAQGYMGVDSRTRWYDRTLNPVPLTDVTGTVGYNMVSVTGLKSSQDDFQKTRSHPIAVHIAIPKLNNPPITGTQEYSPLAAGSNLNFLGIMNAYFGTILGKPFISFI